ncbi:hypothetical protein ACFFJ7_12555 [Pseudochelatococcus lubricantis]|uniref:hypothetical protein n=1 Tax=Pseudochelatococcus lubricantis TaxID=1538102 RepID=UPI0035E68C6F
MCDNDCATVVEILIPGPQGPGGVGNSGIGGYSVAVENAAEGHTLVFDGEVWENRPQPAGQGDMKKAVYDADGDGKVDVAAAADAVAWAGIADVPQSFPPAAHAHDTAQVTGLDAALAAKAPLDSPTFTGVPTAPTAEPGANGGQLATTAFVTASIGAFEPAVTWDAIAGRPEAYPPATHDHGMAEIAGLGEALAQAGRIAGPATTLAGALAYFDDTTGALLSSGDDTMTSLTTALEAIAGAIAEHPGTTPSAPTWEMLTGKPAAFPPAEHLHPLSDVTGLDAALGGKADASALPAPASAGALLAGADDAAFATGKGIADANAPVALDATGETVAIDLAAGLNFTLALPDSRTVANPANARPGQSGSIWVTRTAAGAVPSFGAHWRPAGGGSAFSADTNAADLVTFLVIAPGVVAYTVLGGFAA